MLPLSIKLSHRGMALLTCAESQILTVGTTKPKVGTISPPPLQSAEGQKQRQGRHQG